MTMIDARVRDPNACREIVISCLEHLFGIIGENGRFTYAHKAGRPDIELDGYNLLRHCGTVWFMCTAITQLNVELSPTHSRLLGGAVGYVLKKVHQPAWNETPLPQLCLVTKDSVKLGGTGLAALMLRGYQNLLHRNNDMAEGNGLELRSSLPKLENYIQSQASSTDFIHKRRFGTGEILDFRSEYYTGEAILGFFSGGRTDPAIVRLFERLLKDGYGLDTQSHWMAYAACEAINRSILGGPVITQYLVRLTRAIIDDPSYRARRQSTPIACRSEALTILLATLRRHPLLAMQFPPELHAEAQRCIEENLTLQLHWHGDGQFWKGDDDDKVQIDYIQHNGASFLNWLQIAGSAANSKRSPLRELSKSNPSPIGALSIVHQPHSDAFVTRKDFETLRPNQFEPQATQRVWRMLASVFESRGYENWKIGSFADRPGDDWRMGDTNRFTKDGRKVFIHAAETGFTSLLASKVLKEKTLGKTLMNLAGAKTAEGRVFERGDYAQARSYCASIAPCVVKPVNGSLSRGVTVAVDLDNFQSAWKFAKKATNSQILIERYLRGPKARYLVVGNRCVAVLQETQPYIVGDGTRNIAELCLEKNAMRSLNPYLRDYPIVTGEKQDCFLRSVGLQSSSVPAKGQLVFLQEKPDLVEGGDTIDITDQADPEIKSSAEAITKFLPGMDVIGFDVVARDHCSPKGGGDYVFLEGNTFPDIKEHHFPTFGQSIDVAALIVDHCERQALTLVSDGCRATIAETGRLSYPDVTTMRENIYPEGLEFDPHRDLIQKLTPLGFGVAPFGKFLLAEAQSSHMLFHYADTSFTSRIGSRLLKKKAMTKAVLQEAGISVPAGEIVGKLERSRAFDVVKALGVAVVKPAAGHEGIGVSVEVTEENFDAAWDQVLPHTSGEIIIEKFFGRATEARYLVVDGRCVAVFMRLPPHITGNGGDSIEDLLAAKNSRRAKNPFLRMFPIEMTPYRLTLLQSRGLDLRSIPAAGAYVPIDLKGGLTSGGDALTATNIVHAGFKEIAERAYSAFPDLHVAGIDMLAHDHTQEPNPDNYVIVEANTFPALGGHQFPTYGDPEDIYQIIAESCLMRLSNWRKHLCG